MLLGTFTLELFPEHAPKSVANFLKLVEKGYYADKAGFYRNEPGFLLQGGAFLFDKPPPFANVPVEYRSVPFPVASGGCIVLIPLSFARVVFPVPSAWSSWRVARNPTRATPSLPSC
jgi:hypothetical protein